LYIDADANKIAVAVSLAKQTLSIRSVCLPANASNKAKVAKVSIDCLCLSVGSSISICADAIANKSN